MRRNMKFLAGCAALAGIGLILFVIGAAAGGTFSGIQLDASGLHVYAPSLAQDGKDGRGAYEQKEEKVGEFDSIEVSLDYADLRIESSDSDEYTVSYGMEGGSSFRHEVAGRKLIFKQGSHTPSVFFKNVNFTWFSWGNDSNARKEYLTVRVPKDAKLSTVNVCADSGDVVCEKLHADSLDIEAEYGNVNLQDVRAQEIGAILESGNFQLEQVTGESCKVKNEYGNVNLYDIELSGDMEIKVDSGNVKFRNATFRDLGLNSSYGSINGKKMRLRDMELSADSGNCKLTDILFDNCRIQAEYGNVGLELAKPAADYRHKLIAEYGSITVDGQRMGGSYVTLGKGKDGAEGNTDHAGNTENIENTIEITCESGDIDIQ